MSLRDAFNRKGNLHGMIKNLDGVGNREVSLDELALELHETAVSKGFYDSLDMSEFNSQAKQLAMIHSEVTEVLEALRKSQGSHKAVEEIADIVIRTLDLYYALIRAGVVVESLDEVLYEKMEVNSGRPYMHGVKG